MNSGYPHGYVPVLDSGAVISGRLAIGAAAQATGYLNPQGKLVASSLTIIPKHVKVWTFYGELGVATSVPASWMAANSDFVVGPASNITLFHNAGGLFGVSYTDPIDVVPANYEPMWNVPESGWFHDASGKRIYRSLGGNIQNSLNPKSAYTKSAFNSLTASIAASSRGFNFIEVDNADWDRTSAWWRFNTWGTEITTNTAYTAAVQGLLASSALPTIFNGLHDNAGGLAVSGDTAFLPYSSGGMSENCMQDAVGPMRDSAWLFSENTILYTTNQHKWAVCEGESTVGGTDNRVDRTYFMASWWLTYDPNYSVAFPAFYSTGGVLVFPEYKIVPVQPLQTAWTNVSYLLTSTGIYARQFGACYQNGVALGACASFVNPSSTASASLPSIAKNYHHILLLDKNNSYSGGVASWGTALPSYLAPGHAVILAN
jgi:hypothetical protein